MSTKNWSTNFLDPALEAIKDNVNKLILCSSEPTTYTEANTTYNLASTTLSSSDFTGPANGRTSGRKVTIAEKSGVSVSAAGNALWFALVSTTTTTLYYAGRVPDPPTLATPSTITTREIEIEISDPT